MPEETGTPKVYDPSERYGRYAPIRINPEEDALQLHTDGEISGENLKTNTRRSSRDRRKPVDTVAYHILGILGVRNKLTKNIVFITGNLWTRAKVTPQSEMVQKLADFFPEEGALPGHSSQN